MSTTSSSRVDQHHPALWVLVCRWLLILLVAMDLVSSPFHAHSHHGGSAGEFHVEHASEDLDHDDEIHIEAPQVHALGHSLTVLLPADMPRLAEPILVAWLAVPTPATLTTRGLAAMAPSTWTAAPDHIPIADEVHWRPIGRAPPSLHA